MGSRKHSDPRNSISTEIWPGDDILYNLKEDPDESHNLANKYLGKVEKLKNLLKIFGLKKHWNMDFDRFWHSLIVKGMSILILLFVTIPFGLKAQKAKKAEYLDSIKKELTKKWPNNRTINLVYHGHSVPSGYYTGGVVHRFDSYPFMAMKLIKEEYPFAVVNTITTSIGGEQSEQGAARFVSEVLPHKPDVLFIDYALNDRSIGLARAKKAWEKMIRIALRNDIKIILLTPTPDTNVPILEERNILERHSELIRNLAKKYQVGLVDSYEAFKKMVQSGKNLDDYMAQANHPNATGHAIVANLISEWF